MKHFTFNIIIILLVFTVGLLPFLPFVINVYGVASLTREAIILLLSLALCVNIPYENIASKCILIGFTVIQIFNAVISFVYFYYYIEFDKLHITVLFSLILFISLFFAKQLTNKYQFSSEIIDNSEIYYLCPKADDFNGLLSSLFYFPFSGVKVYCNGNVYAYKRGELKKFTGRKSLFYISRCLAFNTKVKYTPDIEKELDMLVGLKWSYQNNCYRTFEPLFGKLKSKFK